MFAIVVKLPIFEPSTAAQSVCIWLTTGENVASAFTILRIVRAIRPAAALGLREIVAGSNTREERKIVLRDLAGAVGHERLRYLISEGQ
jgi:hypothetical protein